MLSFTQEKRDSRTQFFPVIELKAEKIPPKKNLWVFILAGQSNMAGRGKVEPQDTIPSERIFTVNRNGEIIVAKEPLHFYEPSMTGLDCGLSFGKTLISRIPDTISVLLIPAAIGGSSISQWLGDMTHRNVQLLSNFRQKAELGMHYGQIKGILWHQGEGDANQNGIPLYKSRLTELIEIFRKIAGDDHLPVLIGELGSYSRNNENWMKLNEQIRLYALTDSNARIINTSDLGQKGDSVHFDSEAQRKLGQRFAKALLIK